VTLVRRIPNPSTVSLHRRIRSASTSSRRNDLGLALSDVVLIVVVVALRIGGGLFATSAYLILAVSAISSPLWSIRALSLNWLITMFNPGIAAPSGAAEAMRWLVIVAVALRALFSTFHLPAAGTPTGIVALSGFVFVVFIGSLGASYDQEVSVLKLLLFFAGSFGILATFHQASDRHRDVRRWLGVLSATVAILSLPLLFSDIGYLQNGRGFQGILNHSQAFGVFLAIAVVYLCNEVLVRHQRSMFLAAGLLSALVSLPATQSRTGVGALVSGFLLTCLLSALINRQGLRSVSRGLLSPKSVLAVHAALLALMFSFGDVRQAIEDFLFKQSQESSLSNAFYESRGFMAERSFANISSHPFWGIGFGISSNPGALEVRRDPLLSLPIGAPVEKGLLPLAVLEETGVIGFLFFLMLLAALLVPGALQGRFGPLWIACTCLAVNIGESIFLSFGAMGLYQWLILGYAVTPPAALRAPRRDVVSLWRRSRWTGVRSNANCSSDVAAANYLTSP